MRGKPGNIVVLDIGGTHIRIGHWQHNVACSDFKLLDTSVLRVKNAYAVLSSIIKDYADTQQLDLDAVVLGLPGMLNQQTDTISHCNNIKQLEGGGLRASLESTLNCTVLLEQDIMLQLLGEWKAGAAKNSPSVIGVYYGTGIGAAHLVDGKPRVHSSAGLQAGHIPVMAQGKPCICGNTDCIEAYACGHTLIELSQAHNCAVDQLFLNTANEDLQRELDTFVLHQAYLIATLVTLMVPDTIIVGGGIPQMQAYPHSKFLRNVRAHLQKPYPSDTTDISWALLGKTSVLHGARALLG